MSLEILLESTILNKRGVLLIEPLAPLSLVTSMPGSYYRSQREPSDFMLYGMLENLLGWHFSNEGNEKLRDKIIKDLKKYHKKHHKIDLDFNKSSVGYYPLLQCHLTIQRPFIIPYMTSYEDYWTQHLRHDDERHAKGSRNYDYTLEKQINEIYLLPTNEQGGQWSHIFNKNQDGLFPAYYQSPKKREYIVADKLSEIKYYSCPILTTESLFNLLRTALKELNIPIYLGMNEGWVNLSLEVL